MMKVYDLIVMVAARPDFWLPAELPKRGKSTFAGSIFTSIQASEEEFNLLFELIINECFYGWFYSKLTNFLNIFQVYIFRLNRAVILQKRK